MKKHCFLIIFLLFTGTCLTKSQDKMEYKKLPGKALILKSEDHFYALGVPFLKSAFECNKNLKSSDPDCFNPIFIKNPQESFQKLSELGGKTLSIPCEASPNIRCTFFDRKSDTLLVLGPGFPVQRERMLPFVKLFPSYDLLLFDYRGVGSDYHLNKLSLLFPWKWKGFLSWIISKVDFNISGIGTLEEDDVISVVDACKQKKKYQRIFGLGLCFSSYVFARAMTKRPNLFDKLIFDGSWPSLERVAKNIAKNPSLLFSVENPSSNFACLTYQEWFQNFTVGLVEWLTWVNLHTSPLSFYLSRLPCPILFFQCIDDCYCNKEEFEILWNAVKTPKFAVFTNNLHGRNHVWQAEAYKEIAHTFLEDKLNTVIEKFDSAKA